MVKQVEGVWEKPVIVVYQERQEKHESEPVLVMKGRRLEVSHGAEKGTMRGVIHEFFPLMGDVDYIASEEGGENRYVLCWFDDEEADFDKSPRRLTDVIFPNGITSRTGNEGKRTYNATFKTLMAQENVKPKAKVRLGSVVRLIYDSQTGFTEKMAEVIAEGVQSVKGVETELLKIGKAFSVLLLNSADAIILGSPVVYGRVTPRMKAFLEAMQENHALGKLNLSEKAGAAFGSYAFSGGWVIQELSEEMQRLGMRIVAPAVAVVDGMARRKHLRLDRPIVQTCRELGRTVAKQVARLRPRASARYHEQDT